MPFDPTKPADSSLIAAGELRAQFVGLHNESGNLLNQLVQLQSTVLSDTPHNCAAVQTPAEVGFNSANPEIQQLADKLTELISALRR